MKNVRYSDRNIVRNSLKLIIISIKEIISISDRFLVRYADLLNNNSELISAQANILRSRKVSFLDMIIYVKGYLLNGTAAVDKKTFTRVIFRFLFSPYCHWSCNPSVLFSIYILICAFTRIKYYRNTEFKCGEKIKYEIEEITV